MKRHKMPYGSQIFAKGSTKSVESLRQKTLKDRNYSEFDQMNGRHPLQSHVPESTVLYRVRRKKEGNILYFNFELAKEMGLIPENHSHTINEKLKKKLNEVFNIQIINEYDIENKTQINKKDIKENFYMATRYLQLQHPSRTGKTSGDGRSIWNGTFKGKNKIWDISSCGTGATRLSPASARHKKFFKTGDPSVSYGCGLALAKDGLSAAVMSEVFHRSGIPTERTLAIIENQKGLSINVRASENLIRPSHMFLHLRQENYKALKNLLDLYIERQTQNKVYPSVPPSEEKYKMFLEKIISDFAYVTALYESEYIFCWMDWDGDNVLMNGGIIDYGSVRQFGLYHTEYRYDDDDRWSTSIPEQFKKSKLIVQNFIQLVNYIKTKKKKPLKYFSHSKELKKFDILFQEYKNEIFLKKCGLTQSQREFLLKNESQFVFSIRADYEFFEKQQSTRGVYKVSDGITSDALFCMRDLLRLYPRKLLQKYEALDAEEFISLMKSSYAKKKDLKIFPNRKKHISAFQKKYFMLIEKLVTFSNGTKNHDQILRSLGFYALVYNRRECMTGDGAILAANSMYRIRNKLERNEFFKKIEEFIQYQKTGTDIKSFHELSPFVQKWVAIILKNREGI